MVIVLYGKKSIGVHRRFYRNLVMDKITFHDTYYNSTSFSTVSVQPHSDEPGTSLTVLATICFFKGTCQVLPINEFMVFQPLSQITPVHGHRVLFAPSDTFLPQVSCMRPFL